MRSALNGVAGAYSEHVPLNTYDPDAADYSEITRSTVSGRRAPQLREDRSELETTSSDANLTAIEDGATNS